MKQISKRLLSVLLTLLLVVLLWTPSFAVLAEDIKTTLPTVYLQGQGYDLWSEKGNLKSEKIDNVEEPDGYIEDTAKELVGPLLKGLVLNQWSEWEDIFVDRVAPLYDKIALDENGEASDGSGPYQWAPGTKDRKSSDGKYRLNAYIFCYDWRLDPCVCADELNVYINEIKTSTGFEKVNLIGRSIGANVALAYLTKYGMDDVASAILYCGGFYGMEATSRIFAGKLEIDTAALSRFLDFYVDSGELGESNAQLYAVLKDMVAAMVKTGGLKLTAKTLERIYDKVYRDVYPRLLVKMYGSMPSFWSLVGDDDYEDAKALIFNGQEDVYAKMIEKIDNFHYNVLVPAKKTLTDLVEAGERVYIVAKYGVPMVPTNDCVNEQSDMLTTVRSASPDATCGPIDGTLPQSYIDALTDKRYLSPDRQIDASTCLLPAHTWFIKNVGHREMPDDISTLFRAIYEYDGYMTVFDDAAFPQYLFFDRGTEEMSPLTTENMTTNEQWNMSYFQRLFRFWQELGVLIRDWFRSKFASA